MDTLMTTNIATAVLVVKVKAWERMKMLSKMDSKTIRASGYNSIEAALMDTMLLSIENIEQILLKYEQDNP